MLHTCNIFSSDFSSLHIDAELIEEIIRIADCSELSVSHINVLKWELF